jgi:putative colanic acid biosynthesis UDP-glucose lipid carrier transferase
MTWVMISTETINNSIEVTISSKKEAGLKLLPAKKSRYHTWKSVFDFLISILCTITVLSWLLPVVALLIIIDSRGPVFFLQRRVGRHGRNFTCLKFRTMIVNPEAHARPAEPNDIRITRIGRFLRRSKIDEFPQFLNVLVGDMSVVGPRPLMEADFSKFASLIPNFPMRNLIKPGITGWSQVKGFHGPSKSFESIFYRYYWDMEYIQQANFWLDLQIIGRTAALHYY